VRNWVLGTVTSVMGVAGLFVSSHAGHGIAYYGGLLFFLFAMLFVMLLVKVGYDEVGEGAELSEVPGYLSKFAGILMPASRSAGPENIVVRSIGTVDLRDSLAKGFSDFMLRPTHLIVLCVIYPVVGFIFARLTFGYDILPMLFPLVSGFSLVGPLAATGLYELSRRREQGLDTSWWHVFDVRRSESIHAIGTLGIVLALLLAGWLFAAQEIYELYFGSWVPNSISELAHRVFTTSSGWQLIAVGCGVGFLFAVVVLTISVVSLPMLLDRNVGVVTAVRTSVRAVVANPMTMAIWGMIVVGTLVLGSLPLFVGLAIVVPVLGHATWHLYRRVIAR
jgi:uncharacterized membrane protein